MENDGRLPALAALNEPMRRRLYDYVAAQGSAISREDAAAALGMARSVAAFHLDKLAGVGLLEVEYRRPPGRGGSRSRPAGKDVQPGCRRDRAQRSRTSL